MFKLLLLLAEGTLVFKCFITGFSEFLLKKYVRLYSLAVTFRGNVWERVHVCLAHAGGRIHYAAL